MSGSKNTSAAVTTENHINSPHGSQELNRIYEQRFGAMEAYRNEVWKVLTAEFFQRYLPNEGTVLDLGAGYGEFINNIRAGRKLAMDLNPKSAERLHPSVQLIQQDCSQPWPVADATLDLVFTSNFFEHLPNKQTLSATLREAQRCLKSNGLLVAMGPNIRFLPGDYWDFWDHYLPLSERSLAEGMETLGFQIVKAHPKFLPYTMARGIRWPVSFISLYLRVPFAWNIVGKQFLVVARKP
jgi:SAM-dependent methyltransferase